MQSFRGMTLDDDNTISKENSKGKQKMDFRVNMETLGNSDFREPSIMSDISMTSDNHQNENENSINSDAESAITSVSVYSQESGGSNSRKRMSRSFDPNSQEDVGKRIKSTETINDERTIVRNAVEMRGRGRPKKAISAEQVDLPEKPRRGRGRPSKSAHNENQGTIHTFFSSIPKKMD
ncbi:uncharacterized protein EV154DRAFT_481563 [Mucor mucedo]|uniref:uncharacterized protein n=1 Tax=Mucor mucedo TaxID=29922 RepID=UPI00221F3B1C|nr:uncharacterized protein EV154DRAFT_481563 [Mucor mucedo]KAI7891045.1 hypothetical protein EV154DRAFT_481563 [Mucor mucedo]